MKVKLFLNNGRKEVFERVTNLHSDIALNCIDFTYIYKDDGENVQFRTITIYNDKIAAINIHMEDD